MQLELDTAGDSVILGVDTHKDFHVAVALDGLGRRLGVTRREDVEAEARRRVAVPPSDEVVEEGVVRDAQREGLDYAAIERQLKHAYEVLGEGAA